MAEGRYQFRPVETSDFGLLRRWLREPHVAEWWGDPDAALAEIEQAMLEAGTDPFIVLCDGRPIGYQQSYDPHAEPGHPYADQPPGTRGIDQSIGEPDMIGQGHGSTFVRAFVERLFAAGAPRVITDPHPRNGRAIRAYEKAGFRMMDRRSTAQWGDALLMVCEPADTIGRAV